MQVRLTEEGQKALGFSPDRLIATMSDNRAFALMSNGMAIPDKGFMTLFDGEVEKPKPALGRPPSLGVRPGPGRPKKEKAVSKRATDREKTIK